MMRKIFALCAMFAGAALIYFVYHKSVGDNVVASPSEAFLLSEEELIRHKSLASEGDCDAAYKVSNHYSFVLNDFDASLPWLRLAARCSNPNAKAELVYLLLKMDKGQKFDSEIEQLIAGLEKIDPQQAENAKRELQTKRRGNSS
jgi:hypothetical protein